MATKRTLSEADTLELYRVSLVNAENQPEIAAVLSEFGYTSQTLQQGKDLLAQARLAYDQNKIEDDESTEARINFFRLKESLVTTYGMHRKKAKVIFRNDPVALSKLNVAGDMPNAFANWLEMVYKFYSVSSTDTAIQSQLARLKVTLQDLTAAQALFNDLVSARAEYLREMGESQEATKAKDAAIARIDNWMRDFYAVARIALDDKPQLLESLGKFVRS